MKDKNRKFRSDKLDKYFKDISGDEKVKTEKKFIYGEEDSAPVEPWEKNLAERIARCGEKNNIDLEAAMEPVSELESRPPEPVSHFKETAPVSHFKETKPISHFKEPEPDDMAGYKNNYSPPNNYNSYNGGMRESQDRNEYMNEPVKKKKKTIGQRIRGLFPQKGDGILEVLRKIIFLGACTAVLVCGGIVLNYYIDTIGTQSGYDDIEKIYNDEKDVRAEEPEPKEENEVWNMFPWAEKLSKQNSDLMAFITIPSNLDDEDGSSDEAAEDVLAYPVVQADDLDKYMHLSFTGEEARAGTLFFDNRIHFDDVVDGKLAEENSDNLVIYGHNMKTGDMFGVLQKYKDYDSFYGEHPIINLDSRYEHYQFKIFSVFIADVSDQSESAYDCWNKFNFDDEEDFYSFVNEAKRRTIRTNDVDVRYGDMLLTLSTCHSIFGEDGPGRLIIMARQVREGEDLLEGTQNSSKNTNIKWPSLYYKWNSNEEYDEEDFVSYEEFNKEKDEAEKDAELKDKEENKNKSE